MNLNLPAFFLADLPPEATLSPGMLEESCRTLKKNRENFLTHRTTGWIINFLHQLSQEWLREDYSFRKLALALGPEATGFPRKVLEQGIDQFFKGLTAENLENLLIQDLGHVDRLDRFSGSTAEKQTDRKSICIGPEFIAHIGGGRLPNPIWQSLVLGLLTRSAQFIKCPSESSLLARLIAHSIYELEPKLGSCLEIATWKGGASHLEAILLAEADCLTVTGSDETVAHFKQAASAHCRVIGYGHRVSLGFITQQSLEGYGWQKVLTGMARDIAFWNQMGCLSPHVFYLESGGRFSAEQVAGQLAEELAKVETTNPRGPVSFETSGAITKRRSLYELRSAYASSTQLHSSPDGTAWTIVYEEDPIFQESCRNRFIYIKGVKDLTAALQGADAIRRQVSTVALAAPDYRKEKLAMELARWGALRICSLGDMQNPSFLWRHDGRPSLADLVTWVDWENAT